MPSDKGRGGANALWDGLKAEHERYKQSVSYIPTARLKLQEDLRRYLCLRCAGFLEQMTFVLLTEHIEQKGSGPVREFAVSYFRHAPNLRAQPYIDLIGRFGPAYRAAFESFLGSTRRDALSDLLEVRNDIAHGKYHAGQKLDPERYMRLCEDVYDWMVATFLGDSVEIIAGDGYTRIGVERVVGTPS